MESGVEEAEELPIFRPPVALPSSDCDRVDTDRLRVDTGGGSGALLALAAWLKSASVDRPTPLGAWGLVPGMKALRGSSAFSPGRGGSACAASLSGVRESLERRVVTPCASIRTRCRPSEGVLATNCGPTSPTGFSRHCCPYSTVLDKGATQQPGSISRTCTRRPKALGDAVLLQVQSVRCRSGVPGSNSVAKPYRCAILQPICMSRITFHPSDVLIFIHSPD